MREMKFRVWDNGRKEWVHGPGDEVNLFGETILYGELLRRPDDTHVKLDDLNDMIALQFTGLKDKNGKEIYEGDILRLSDGDVSHHRIYYDTKAGRWMDERLEDGASLTCYDEFAFVTDCKVIGNIYENPELLKQ